MTKQEKDTSTLKLISAVWRRLSKERKYQVCLLLTAMIASSFSELLSLGAVIPFLTILSNQDRILENPIIARIASAGIITNSNTLILIVISGLGIAVTISGAIRLLNLWLSTKLAAKIGSDLSCEAYKRIMYQSYTFHTRINSSTFITATTTQIAKTVRALGTFLQIVAAGFVATGIVAGLVIINASVVLTAGVVLGSAYFWLSVKARKKLRRNSGKIKQAEGQQIKLLQEGFGSIRDVLIHDEQGKYTDQYTNIDVPLRGLQAENDFLGGYPRYLIETIGFIGIFALGYILLIKDGAQSELIPTLGAFAMGAQKLLPALQQIYGGWARIKGASESINVVISLTNLRMPETYKKTKEAMDIESFTMNKVFFRYDDKSEDLLKNINIKIEKNDKIGIVGKTGSGKTTLTDLILGLLTPKSGTICVNDVVLDLDDAKTKRIWQNTVSHVPQEIYLSDKTIAENIASVSSLSEIDMDKLYLSAKKANIHDFIMDMDEGYLSKAGEQGAKLSGGQKQRIGIARALYRETKVLILDEATSALDSETENDVINAIENLDEDLIVIMIAHRKNTLKSCNKVFEIKDKTIYTQNIK